ncbi:MAG: isoprenylcysteine carboxylmethyltransferase family protein [Isosphaeraceae bacterium]|nr:isoprenylcysteine carboxylmethyltransferase family protein [Isosphaeraceae bacterium]
MAHRMPSPAALLLMILSGVLFLGLAAWGWGSGSGLLAHPARAGACLVVVLATVAALFAGLNLSGFQRPGAHGYWLLVPIALITVALAWLPAYTDRRDLGTLDGDMVRYLGLALLAIGSVLRVGPMFVLGRRFTWPLATHEEHRLVTTGFYRFIRHPSYLGALLGGIGWVLVFRSGIGLLLMGLLVPVFLAVIRAEEALLRSEFGEAYAAYQRRTWRLLPFLY